jgi:hypothetical protein
VLGCAVVPNEGDDAATYKGESRSHDGRELVERAGEDLHVGLG